MSLPIEMPMLRLRRLVSPKEEAEAGTVLGLDHTLVRLLGLRRSLVVQVLVTAIAILFGMVGSARDVTIAPFELAAAIGVALVLAGGLLFIRSHLRGQAQELIASGFAGGGLRIVDVERRRLLSPSERQRIARWYEALLRDSQCQVTSAAVGPLPEVGRLRFLAAEISDIAAMLRSGPVNAAGVARAMRLLDGGLNALLFSGDVERIRHELRRIRALLDSTPPVADSDRLAA
jgi:hypothetical protein